MRHQFLKAMFCCFLLTAVNGIVSCKKDKDKDKCEDVVCQNGGSCNDGVCSCPAGYEGTNCQTEIREKFLGNFLVVADPSCSDPALEEPWNDIPASVTAVPNDASKIQIDIAQAIIVTASVNGNEITIDPTTINGYAYSGNGSLSGSNLNITLDETHNGITCTYTITAQKQ